MLNQSAVAGAKSLAEIKHSERLGKTFLVGWLGGLVGGSEKLRIRLKLSTAGAWALLSLATSWG